VTRVQTRDNSHAWRVSLTHFQLTRAFPPTKNYLIHFNLTLLSTFYLFATTEHCSTMANTGLKIHKMRWRPGLCRGPSWEAYSAPQTPAGVWKPQEKQTGWRKKERKTMGRRERCGWKGRL